MATRSRTRTSAKRRALVPEDLFRLVVPGVPRISPDGTRMVFVRTHFERPNKTVRSLWMAPAEGGDPAPFTAGERDGQPCWSPDGAAIAFVRDPGPDGEGGPQVHLIAADGGEARPVTELPEGSIRDLAWSPDGARLAACFRATAEERTKEAAKSRKADKASDPPLVTDDLWYRLDGDGYFGSDRHVLIVIDAATGDVRTLWKKDTLGDLTYDWSPDGRSLLVATNVHRRALTKHDATKLVVIDAQKGTAKDVPGLPAGPKTRPRWSPDGKRIAWAGRLHEPELPWGEDDLYSTENVGLFVAPATGGRATDLLAGTDECLMAVALSDTSEASFAPAFEWTPKGDRLLFRLGKDGETHVASIAATGRGGIAVHTSGALDVNGDRPVAGPRGAIRVPVAIAEPTRPPEVGLLVIATPAKDGGELARRSDFNGAFLKEVAIARPTQSQVRTDDGHRVHTWTIRPPKEIARRKRNPAVVQVHGGPHGMYGSGFFLEFQVLASAGHVVVYSNPRGSKGYGRDHTAAIRGAWGTHDWTDVSAVVDHAMGLDDVDRKRVGIMGGSYGGYMTNWAVAHRHDLKAAITDRCVSNLVSMGGNSDFPDVPGRYFPGPFWESPEALRAQSPIMHAGRIRTPMMIIHSEGDLRCNVEQAEQLFSVLRMRNVPATLVRYPRSTSHGMSRSGPPDLRIDRLTRILDWWEGHL